MRILIAADVAPVAQGSGAERLLQAHARELARRRHEVRIVFRSNESVPTTGNEWEGCRLFPYAIDRKGNLAFVRTTLRNGAEAFNSATVGWAPEAIIIYQPFTGMVVLRRRRSSVPVLYTFLSPAPAEYIRQSRSAGIHGPLVTRGIQWAENYALLGSDKISVLSNFMRDEIRHWHPRVEDSRIVRIPGGVDTEWFRPIADRAGLREELGYPTDRKLLLTVRNLEPRTGVDNLVKAIGHLAHQRRDFLLLIAGRGPLERILHEAVSESRLDDVVRFLGFVPEEALVRLYGAADLYIQPDTDLQGFGLPIVEAMACGTPVVATPVGGALDALDSIGTEHLFSSLDPSTVASELGSILDTPAILHDRERYRRIAEERFAWPRIIDQVEDVFATLDRRQSQPIGSS